MTTELDIFRLSELSVDEPLSLLLFGGSGAGKTFFCGTAGDRCVIIDCGIGPIETLKSKVFQQKVGANPIIIRVREMFNEDLIPLGQGYDLVCDAIDYALENYGEDIDTICIDNATALRKFSMNKGVILSSASQKSQTFSTMAAGNLLSIPIGKGSFKAERPPVIFPAVQDYGAEMVLVEWLAATHIDLCKRAGKNFILTAHERKEYKKAPKLGDPPTLVKTRPGFTGQTFPDDIPALFDEVWYIEPVPGREGNVPRIKAYGDDSLVAKTTRGAGILKNPESDPNFLKLLDRIRSATKP